MQAKYDEVGSKYEEMKVGFWIVVTRITRETISVKERIQRYT